MFKLEDVEAAIADTVRSVRSRPLRIRYPDSSITEWTMFHHDASLPIRNLENIPLGGHNAIDDVDLLDRDKE